MFLKWLDDKSNVGLVDMKGDESMLSLRNSAIKLTGFILILFFTGVIFFGSAEMASSQTVTWKVATHRPDNDDATKYLRQIKANVEKRTGGKFKWDLYTGPALGGWEDIFAALIDGNVAMAYVPFDSGYDPRLQLLYLPFLATSWDEAIAMYKPDGWLTKAYDKIGKLYNLKALGWGVIGPLAIDTRNKQVKSMEDLKGLKIRVPGFSVVVDTWQAWGAIATPMPKAELYTALQTGVVDGEDNSAYSVYMFTKDVQKYYTDLHQTYEALPVIVNLNSFKALPAEYQKIIQEEVGGMCDELTKSAKERDTLYLKKLHDEYGWTITHITPEQKQRFFEKARAVWPTFTKYLGKDLLKICMEQIKK